MTTRAYWLCNAAMLVGTVLLVSLVMVPFIQVSAMGVLMGSIAGIKMGFGESVGPWKWLDNFMDINRRHRRVAEKGTGEAYRRRRNVATAGWPRRARARRIAAVARRARPVRTSSPLTKRARRPASERDALLTLALILWQERFEVSTRQKNPPSS